MLIRVDFFKASGKWYEGGLVDIGKAKLWDDNFLELIWEKQEILSANTDRSQWTVVIADTPENDLDPNYHDFFKAVLQIGRG